MQIGEGEVAPKVLAAFMHQEGAPKKKASYEG